VTIEDVRTVHESLHRADLNSIRQPLIDLVIRLRQAGIPISDRRAVKLQRLIAASALLSGRRGALVSDLWVCRYVWDTVEQQEVLAAVVREAVSRVPADDRDHPRSRGAEAPDPESLARDLDDLSERLAETDMSPGGRASLRDRLGVLAGRCQWVGNEAQRTALLERVEGLWKRVASQA
jgi:MoxR-like ATPase